MKDDNRIWRTAFVLLLAIIGVVAGLILASNQQAKLQVRQQRVNNIDNAVTDALEVAKTAMNKRLPDETRSGLTSTTPGTYAKIASQALEKQSRAFNSCYEELSSLNNQRRQVEDMISELKENESISTILTVVCAILGLYAASSLQRRG